MYALNISKMMVIPLAAILVACSGVPLADSKLCSASTLPMDVSRATPQAPRMAGQVKRTL